MNKLMTALVAATIITCGVAGQALAVPSIWNTGVDGAGVVLADGLTDSHFTLVTPSGAAPAIATSPDPWWPAPMGDSKWIAPTSSAITDPVGDYTYTQTFALTADEIPDSLSGYWATDNGGEVYFNGVATGFMAGLDNLEYFVITDGFIVGDNILEFRTVNVPTGVVGGSHNPTGLLVSEMSLNYGIPAPAAVVLAGLGSCVVGFVRRRGIL